VQVMPNFTLPQETHLYNEHTRRYLPFMEDY
jgi:hypothetical protein